MRDDNSVLVVDDDAVILDLVGDVLGQAGYAVRTSRSGDSHARENRLNSCRFTRPSAFQSKGLETSSQTTSYAPTSTYIS